MNGITTLLESDDDEIFLEIPDELFEVLGWDDGTILTWDVVGDSIRISRAPEETIGEALLPEQSRVVRSLQSVSGSDSGVQPEDGEVVG
jgi:bifunctional DNA-binding transcriptional regulator/antitoxin component of YhaV-PrlF toxin-antitoxin module